MCVCVLKNDFVDGQFGLLSLFFFRVVVLGHLALVRATGSAERMPPVTVMSIEPQTPALSKDGYFMLFLMQTCGPIFSLWKCWRKLSCVSLGLLSASTKASEGSGNVTMYIPVFGTVLAVFSCVLANVVVRVSPLHPPPLKFIL